MILEMTMGKAMVGKEIIGDTGYEIGEGVD